VEELEVRKWVVRQNIERLQNALRDEQDPEERKTLEAMLAEHKRALVTLMASLDAQGPAPTATSPESGTGSDPPAKR